MQRKRRKAKKIPQKVRGKGFQLYCHISVNGRLYKYKLVNHILTSDVRIEINGSLHPSIKILVLIPLLRYSHSNAHISSVQELRDFIASL